MVRRSSTKVPLTKVMTLAPLVAFTPFAGLISLYSVPVSSSQYRSRYSESSQKPTADPTQIEMRHRYPMARIVPLRRKQPMTRKKKARNRHAPMMP